MPTNTQKLTPAGQPPVLALATGSAPSSRAEHLAWCKQRALEYCDAGDVDQAFASMASDLGKHPETEGHMGIQLGMTQLMGGMLSSPAQMRRPAALERTMLPAPSISQTPTGSNSSTSLSRPSLARSASSVSFCSVMSIWQPIQVRRSVTASASTLPRESTQRQEPSLCRTRKRFS